MAWFQDGTKLLLSGIATTGGETRAIWAVSTVTGNLRRLREGVWGAAAISPDSSRIAFKPLRRDEIWLMGASGENPRKLLSLPEGYFVERLAWSPGGSRLAYLKTSGMLDQVAIESVDAEGRASVSMLADQRLNDFCWGPDGRVFYSLSEPPPNEYDSNLWEIRVAEDTGRISGTPRRITNWAGFSFQDLGLSRDGKRLGFIGRRDQSDVYLAELKSGGAQLANVKRMTVDDRIDWPGAWTQDSKAVLFYSDRNGNLDIFRQDIGASTGDPVIQGPDEKRAPQPSPDGKWILYLTWPKSGCCAAPQAGRLMRWPVSGGQAEPVFEVKGYPGSAQVARSRMILTARGQPDFRCPQRPAAPCVLGEREGGQLVLTAFDPLQGRKGEVVRIRLDSARAVDWDLSPDGSRIAVAHEETDRAVIQIVPLSGGAPREIPLPGRSRLRSVAWSADGASLFATTVSTQQGSLLHVAMSGGIHVLRQVTGWLERPMASPDGKYLAFGESVTNANVWMIENF